MSAPNPKRQKKARRVLDEVFANTKHVRIIHYSCESFYDREDGSSPRITSIAVRHVETGQTDSFSIHQVAEKRKIASSDIEKHYDDLEKAMLSEVFDYLSKFHGYTYLHWNMRDANYGFQAIEHRFQVLGGTEDQLHVVQEDQKIDLARLLHDIYGSGYVGHPRLEKLLRLNSIAERGFLPGAEEALAFEQHRFVDLHLSTLRKVDVIQNIATRVHDRKLKTNVTWWQMRGGSVINVINWIGEHPLYTFVGGLVTLIATAIGVWASCT